MSPPPSDYAVLAKRTDGPVAGGEEFTYAVLPSAPPPGSAQRPIGQGGERRAGTRQRTRLRSGKVVDGDGRFVAECLIANRSSIGGLLRLPQTTTLPARILLYDDQTGEVQPAAVVWRREREAGLRFLPIEPGERYRAIAGAMRRKFYAMARRSVDARDP